MSDTQNQSQAPAQEISIPPVSLSVPWPVFETIMKGLGKLTIDECGPAYFQLQQFGQQHLRNALHAAKNPPAAPVKTAKRKR